MNWIVFFFMLTLNYAWHNIFSSRVSLKIYHEQIILHKKNPTKKMRVREMKKIMHVIKLLNNNKSNE